MIVEDSLVVRELLSHIISNDPRLMVVEAVASGEEALAKLESARPDVISMDIQLPGIDGVDTTREIMIRRPTPIVIVASGVSANHGILAMRAMRAGALTAIDKPVGTTHPDFAAVANTICTQLAIMSEVHVVRQRPQPLAAAPGSAGHSPLPQPSSASPARMLGIVASTGGPAALSTLLRDLGPGFGLPIALVQHIAPSFLEGFVTWLNDTTPFRVTIAKNGQLAVPGEIYVPPPDRHLEVDGARLRLSGAPPISHHRPSGTALFNSMALSLGRSGIGVLLTGMGDDGAAGLMALKSNGGYTIAESKSTAVVFGMPAVAIKMGAARAVLPLPDIGRRIRAVLLTPSPSPQ
ncbi:MAG: chemotaxis response regulator protein-glutamate methylesterase [Rhodospirillaceae bacterium]|nr:chemotaxis response regulator protein-glutamate methylesterase [Rhodospirillaceae bacterium]